MGAEICRSSWGADGAEDAKEAFDPSNQGRGINNSKSTYMARTLGSGFQTKYHRTGRGAFLGNRGAILLRWVVVELGVD